MQKVVLLMQSEEDFFGLESLQRKWKVLDSVNSTTWSEDSMTY